MRSWPSAAAAAIAIAAVAPCAARGTAALRAARNVGVGHDTPVPRRLCHVAIPSMLLPLRRLQRHNVRRRAVPPGDAAAVPTTAVRTADATGSAHTADPTTFSARASTNS